jgi:glycosyltransferase involved in cell wall biosynthesis
MHKASVSIALCTFNGERYLGDLLESLLLQSTLPRELVVCDDRSTDSTTELLQEFSSRAPFNVNIIINRNHLGVIHNFETAFAACSAEYIAPCDQDDVWKPDKLEKLLSLAGQMKAGKRHGPYFVHTDVDLVDSQLHKTGVTFLEHQALTPPRTNQYKTLIAQNYIPGCSSMFSRELLEYALPIPEEAVMHDWWLALIASIAGEIRYDPSTTVLYRQHAENVLGSEPRLSLKTLRRIISIRPALGIIEKNFTASARQAIAAAQRLSGKNVILPEAVAGYTDSLGSSRLKSLGKVMTGKVGRANFLRNLTLLAAILLYDKQNLQG